EFYLQTIDVVFQRHALPKGEMMHRGRRVDPAAITDIAVLAIEGERDDISGIGQTRAALDISTGLDAKRKKYHLAKGVGHYAIFSTVSVIGGAPCRMAGLIGGSEYWVMCEARSEWLVCTLCASSTVTAEIPIEPPTLRERFSRLAAVVRNLGFSVPKASVFSGTNRKPSAKPWMMPLVMIGARSICSEKPDIRCRDQAISPMPNRISRRASILPTSRPTTSMDRRVPTPRGAVRKPD